MQEKSGTDQADNPTARSFADVLSCVLQALNTDGAGRSFQRPLWEGVARGEFEERAGAEAESIKNHQQIPSARLVRWLVRVEGYKIFTTLRRVHAPFNPCAVVLRCCP